MKYSKKTLTIFKSEILQNILFSNNKKYDNLVVYVRICELPSAGNLCKFCSDVLI